MTGSKLRYWRSFYLLECLHMQWYRYGKDKILCPECDEMKRVIYVMGVKK